MTAAAQALKPRPGRRSQQQQRPPSPPRAASPAAGSASAASMLPGHPRSGAAAAAAGQGAHLPAAVATARALPGAASQGAPQAHRIPPGFGNLDGFLPPESRPGQQVGSAVYMFDANESMTQADSLPAWRSLYVWGTQAFCGAIPVFPYLSLVKWNQQQAARPICSSMGRLPCRPQLCPNRPSSSAPSSSAPTSRQSCRQALLRRQPCSRAPAQGCPGQSSPGPQGLEPGLLHREPSLCHLRSQQQQRLLSLLLLLLRLGQILGRPELRKTALGWPLCAAPSPK